MSSPTGQRPGGLTALAVLNFIFGGLYALGFIGLLTLLGLANSATRGEVNRVGAGEAPIMALLYVALLLIGLNTFLLIASGVGYIQQSRTWGKTLGTVYGILGLVGTAVSVIGSKEFGLQNIIGLIYPVLTLVLLNTVFKDDFPN